METYIWNIITFANNTKIILRPQKLRAADRYFETFLS